MNRIPVTDGKAFQSGHFQQYTDLFLLPGPFLMYFVVATVPSFPIREKKGEIEGADGTPLVVGAVSQPSHLVVHLIERLSR